MGWHVIKWEDKVHSSWEYGGIRRKFDPFAQEFAGDGWKRNDEIERDEMQSREWIKI